MIKVFFKHSLVYSISGLLTKGLPVLLLPFYTSVLSPLEFGYWEYILAVGGIVSVLIPLEITQGMARFFPEAVNEEEVADYITSTLVFTFSAYLILLLIGICFSDFFSRILTDGHGGIGILVLSLFLFLINGLLYAIQNILRWKMLALDNTILSLIVALSFISSAIIMLKLQFGLLGLILASITSCLVGLIYPLFIKKSFTFGFYKWDKVKQMLNFSLPLVPSSLGVVAALYVDRLLIKNLLDVDSMAYYSVAYRISSVIVLITLGFQGALSPLIYSNYQKLETRSDLAKLFRICIAICLLLCTSVSLFINEGITIFFKETYISASNIIPFLLFSTLIWQLYIFAPGLSLEKKTKKIAIINLFIAVLNLTLNYIFIIKFGLMGSAIATTIAATCSFILYMYFSQRYYFVKHDWITLIQGVVISITVLFIGSLVPSKFIFIKVLLLVSLFFLFIRLGLLTRSDWKQVLS
jgi:O-antigen/teichoic acid export membrane protein